jgi:hypothetical protein
MGGSYHPTGTRSKNATRGYRYAGGSSCSWTVCLRGGKVGGGGKSHVYLPVGYAQTECKDIARVYMLIGQGL